MADFFEIDFLDVETSKSGDAIAIRYEQNGGQTIHVVDGGFQATGQSLAAHIRKHYGNPVWIDHVVVTHGDADHSGGLRTILEEFGVGALWMLRPWAYADTLIERFETYNSVPHLVARLKRIYPNLAVLEEIAIERGIPIYEPFQGAQIGAFTVLSPSPDFYFDLVIESDKTPEHVEDESVVEGVGRALANLYQKAVSLWAAAWGQELFPAEGTSNENEMSVVQYAYLCDQKILLTGDAGREALSHAADYLEGRGVLLPGIDKFQVPHHGSRRNVSTEVLNRWLGPALPYQLAAGQETFWAFCSSAKADPDHPRNAVRRAFIHRGAGFIATEGRTICAHKNGPQRDGWGPVTGDPYPYEQED